MLDQIQKGLRTKDEEWYENEAKRREVIVRFFERRLNQSLRPVSGSMPSRLMRVTKQLQDRGRLLEYIYVVKIVEARARHSFPSHIKLFTGVPMTRNAIKQILRRLDYVASELKLGPPRFHRKGDRMLY